MGEQLGAERGIGMERRGEKSGEGGRREGWRRAGEQLEAGRRNWKGKMKLEREGEGKGGGGGEDGGGCWETGGGVYAKV